MKFKVKLMRPRYYVTLELVEGGHPFMKGSWRRLERESNCALQHEGGAWENSVLGTPGSVRNIRLYDPSDRKAALLKDYLAGGTSGPGTIMLPDFAGTFGAGDFHWVQLSCVPFSQPIEFSKPAMSHNWIEPRR